MANQDLETATYVLQIVTPPQGDKSNSTIYKLENKEYHSPEELIRSITEINEHQTQLDLVQSEPGDVDLNLNHILALQSIILRTKTHLDRIRFLMTDRITSALMKITLLNAKNQNSFSDSEQYWINQGLSDLTQLGFAIEEWTRLCEMIDVKQLEDPAKLNKMLINMSSFSSPPI